MRFTLQSDDDGHWYLVPVEQLAAWGAWLALDPEEEDAWLAPDFARPINGSPSNVSFENPEQM